jgi:predicted transcriptional regulator
MTTEKFSKMQGDLKNALPDVGFPSYDQIARVVSEIKDILANAVARIEFVVSH